MGADTRSAHCNESVTRRHGGGTPLTAHVITNVIVDEVPGDPDEMLVRSPVHRP